MAGHGDTWSVSIFVAIILDIPLLEHPSLLLRSSITYLEHDWEALAPRKSAGILLVVIYGSKYLPQFLQL